MSNKIKFRVWDNKYQKWMTSGFDKNHGIDHFIAPGGRGYSLSSIITNETMTDDIHHQIPYNGKNPRWIIQQYTGMKDSNNVDIYEGDIVCEKLLENTTEKAHIGIIYFGSGIYMISGDCSMYDHTMNASPDILQDYLVVGNVFENSELLNNNEL